MLNAKYLPALFNLLMHALETACPSFSTHTAVEILSCDTDQWLSTCLETLGITSLCLCILMLFLMYLGSGLHF